MQRTWRHPNGAGSAAIYKGIDQAVDFLYERHYSRGRNPRASDCRDLLETVQSICRFRRIPVQLTTELMADAAQSFICEFK